MTDSMAIGDSRRLGRDAAAARSIRDAEARRSRRARRSALDAGDRHPQRRRQRARRGRGGGRGRSRRMPASTPGAAACSPPTAVSSSTPRSWTAAPAAPARSPDCARPAPRSASRGTLMEQGPHVFLSGKGADQFAARARPRAGRQRLVRDCRAPPPARRIARQRRVRRRGQIWHRSARSRSMPHGHVAAATSTGGLTAKRWGRVGDSPLIGAGTYADDRSAAVSATGSGEYFIRAVAAHQLAARVRHRRRRLAGGARRGARRHRSAWRQGRVDRGRARRAKRRGASRRPAMYRGMRRRRRRAASRSMPTRRAIGQAAAAASRLPGRSQRARARRNPRPPRGSSGWEMKCAERVITGS